LTWLGEAAEEARGYSFGPALIAALAPAIDAVFELAPDALKRGESRPLDALLQRHFSASLAKRELELDCEPPARIEWLGTIAP
jgi:hypothetical protein